MLADLTAEQEKALIEAVTKAWGGWSDAWDRGLDDADREEVAEAFLDGVRWAEAKHGHEEYPFLAGVYWAKEQRR